MLYEEDNARKPWKMQELSRDEGWSRCRSAPCPHLHYPYPLSFHQDFSPSPTVSFSNPNRKSCKLLWLSEEEAEIIRLIRLSQMKDIATSRHNAAVCIQQWWRKYVRRRRRIKCIENKKFVEPKVLLQRFLAPSSVNNLVKNEGLERLQYASQQRAARTIQRFWRDWHRRHQQLKCSTKKLPGSIKEFYAMIKLRHVNAGLQPPPYEKILRLLNRIRAATMGARVRRRLKSRRLRTVIKEIKEIRALLVDLKNDPATESSGNLFSQLNGQLQQKLVQLQTALQGTQDAARYLLRRGPSTPLLMGNARVSAPPEKEGHRELDDHTGELRKSHVQLPPEHEVSPRKNKTEKPLRKPTVTVSQEKTETSQPSNSWSFLVKNSASCGNNSQGDSLDKKSKGHLHIGKVVADEAVASRQSQARFEVMTGDRMNKMEEDATASMTRSTTSSERNPDETEQSEQEDRPKRPFLRRKSVAMAPQKLDWSKVKPMVSSRLEPELKTKLYKSKLKDGTKSSCSKKLNYNNVKSRLFNYETQSERGLETECGLSSTECHPQVDQVESSRPCSANSGMMTSCYSHDEPVHNLRYSEGHNNVQAQINGGTSHEKKEDQSQQCLFGGKGERSYSGEYEKWKQSHKNHSERYAEATVEDVAVLEHVSVKQDKANNQVAAELQHYASEELEKAFKHVMLLKQGKKLKIVELFGACHEKSVVPKLDANSHVFRSTLSEKRKLHEILIQEGRASRLQHDALAFVSIRD